MFRSRTFMRSNTAEPRVGLLLFDEPSASLDPVAEHGECYFIAEYALLMDVRRSF